MATEFRHGVASIIQNVSIVTAAASHAIGAQPTIQGVGGVVANNDVVKFVAGSTDGTTAYEREVLNIIDQRVSDI